MGLISWIKNHYYNHILDNADSAFQSGDIVTAEEEYQKILDKLPDAAAHLAAMYEFEGKNKGEEPKFLQKIKELHPMDVYSFKEIAKTISKLEEHINKKADILFASRDYIKASAYLSSIESEYKSKDWYKARSSLYKFYANLEEYQYSTDTGAKSFISKLEKLFIKNDDYARGIISIAKKLHSSRKYAKAYSLYFILANVGERNGESACVKVALDYYKSSPQAARKFIREEEILSYIQDINPDFSLGIEPFVSYSTVYADKYILESIKKIRGAIKSEQFGLFLHVWKVQPNAKLIEELITPQTAWSKDAISFLLGDFSLINFNKDQEIVNVLIKNVKEFNEASLSLNVLESLYKRGVDVEDKYISIVKDEMKTSITNKEKLEMLETCFTIFNRKDISDLYIDIATKYIEEKVSTKDVVDAFDYVWKKHKDNIFITKFASEEFPYSSDIIKYLLSHSKKSTWTNEQTKALVSVLKDRKDLCYSLDVLDALLAKHVNVKDAYVDFIQKMQARCNLDESLALCNRALSHFTSQDITNKKYEIAQKYIENKELSKAEGVLNTLVGSHKLAQVSIADIKYKESFLTEDINEKKVLIGQGLYFYKEHDDLFDETSYFTIFKLLLKEALHLVDIYCDQKNLKEAYEYSLSLSPFTNQWLDTTCSVIAKEISEYSLEKQIIRLKKILKELKEQNSKTELPASYYDSKTELPASYYALWISYTSNIINSSQSKEYEDAVKYLKSSITFIKKNFIGDDYSSTTKIINQQLANVYKGNAIALEHQCQYEDAIDSYNQLRAIADIRTKAWAIVRITICHLKGDDGISKEQIDKALSYVGFAAEKRDIAYRFAICLLKEDRIDEACSYVNKYLASDKDLQDTIVSIRKEKALKTLSELNERLNTIVNKTSTSEDATSLLEDIDSYDNKISPWLDGVHTKLLKTKSDIKHYIEYRYYKENKFDKLFYTLYAENRNKWYNNNIMLRNLAICCLGMSEYDQIKTDNYELIIALWLTAVYTDSLFVDSLEHTSWDDDFQFTLYGSLGESTEDSYSCLPDNVNFLMPSGGDDVSILEVQQALLGKFEKTLSIYSQDIQDYYESQKDKMDELASLHLLNACRIIAPYFSIHSSKIRSDVKKSLDEEYAYSNDENVLKVGVAYDILDGYYGQYKKSTDIVQDCIEACKSSSSFTINKTFTVTSINQARNFPSLYKSLIVEIQNQLTADIKSCDYKTVMAKYASICKVMNDNTINYILGNFVNQGIVSALNANTLELSVGASQLLEAYKIVPSFAHIKSNLESVTESLVASYLAEGNQKDLDVVKSIIQYSSSFETSVSNAISDQLITLAVIAASGTNRIINLANIPAKTYGLKQKLSSIKTKAADAKVNFELSKIVEAVNNGSMAHNAALEKVYEIYRLNKNNQRVCDNLCTLVGMCIREYLAQGSYGKDSVLTVFNKLKDDKSLTYLSSAQSLKNERQSIISGLPFNVQMLLKNGTWGNQELNASGYELKQALEWYITLS